MKKIGYFCFLIFIFPLSFLPLSILYRFSDGLYGIVFHVLGYRKKVVYDNLEKAFPEYTPEQIDRIARGFYRHFCDLIVENLKLLTIGRQEVQRRCQFLNPQLLTSYTDRQQSVIAVVGHYGNWELGGLGLSLLTDASILAIYKPMSHPDFNRLFKKMRSKFGTILVPMEKIARVLIGRKQETTISVFIADQTPLNPQNSVWLEFMNRETPVYEGTEKIAQKMGYSVIFCKMLRTKRGYYTVEFVPLVDDPGAAPAGLITQKHTKILEDIIRTQPEYWLWSHRRWKHKKPA